MIINGLGSTKENTYYSNSISTNHGNSNFDSTLEAVSIIYAKPDTNKTQTQSCSSSNSSKTIESPSSLETYFKKASDTYGISETLLKAVAKAESDFNPNCTSGAGAMGIMQLMPSTAESLGVTKPYDAEQNIMGGAKLLSQLLAKYNGNISLTLAAYNAGSGNVEKYGGIPPFKETRNYVNKILGYLGTDETITYSDATTIYAQTASNSASQGPIIHTINAVPVSST